MKKFVIFIIFTLVLTNQAYAMGWLGGGGSGSGGSSAGASNSGGKSNSSSSSSTSANTNTASTFIATANNTENSGNTEGPGSGGASTNITAPTPELTTLFLLGSALFGLWGLKRKLRK
jgi:hypothetical protein